MPERLDQLDLDEEFGSNPTAPKSGTGAGGPVQGSPAPCGCEGIAPDLDEPFAPPPAPAAPAAGDSFPGMAPPTLGEDRVLDILAKIPTLNLFSREQLGNMVKSSRVRKYSCGDVIIREGEEGREVFFLLEGCVNVFAGNVKINAIKRSGDVFGEMGVITDEPRSVTLIAASECLCLIIDSERIFTGDPGKNLIYHSILYRSFAEVLARRLRKMNEEIRYLRRELALAQSRGRGGR